MGVGITTKNIDVNVVDQNGYVPLHLAVRNGNIEITKLLLKKRNININAADKDGRASLHHAAQLGYIDLVEYLVKREANVNAVDNHMQTPLHLTAYSGYIKDNYVWINIEEAAKFRHKNTVELLLKKGAAVNLADDEVSTPLHCVGSFGSMG